MDENGEILLLHASKNIACPLILPWLDDFGQTYFQVFVKEIYDLHNICQWE